MPPHLALIGTVALIHFLALVSPGPDFILCVRNSMTYSRKTGLWTAAGFALGIGVHILYSLAGVAVVISQSILLFNSIKFFGAAYLVYIGVRALFSKSSTIKVDEAIKKMDISALAGLRMGFLTNVLNPKATLFFLSVFTLVISPETPLSVMGIIAFILMANTFLWFALVATLFTQARARSVFSRFSVLFDRIFGGLLIALGVKVALTKR